MSWSDKQAIHVIKHLRDKYKVHEFIETGTYKGVNAKLHSTNFERVFTCEKDVKLFRKAKKRLDTCANVISVLQHSPDFLKDYVASYRKEKRRDNVLVYLDAHFYDPELPKGRGKFVILQELKNLINLNCIIVIHDFDNNLGHITYDGISLDFNLLYPGLKKINPKFNYYINTLASCNIVRPNCKDIQNAGMEYHKDILDVLKSAWSEPRLTFRGILYALPTTLTAIEQRELGLRPWGYISIGDA